MLAISLIIFVSALVLTATYLSEKKRREITKKRAILKRKAQL